MTSPGEILAIDIDRLIAEDPYIKLNILINEKLLCDIENLKKSNQQMQLKIADLVNKYSILLERKNSTITKKIDKKGITSVFTASSYQKITCECGALISKASIPKHVLSSKHRVVMMEKNFNRSVA